MFIENEMNLYDEDLLKNKTERYRHYFNKLVNLALTQFKYYNLPETMNERTLELDLLLNGSCAVYTLDKLDVVVNSLYRNDDLINFYGEPVKITGISKNQKNIKTGDFVICYDNRPHRTLFSDFDYYANRLANIDRVIDTNLEQQNTPYIIPMNNGKRNLLRRLVNKITNLANVIFVDRKVLENQEKIIDKLDLQVEFKGNELKDLHKKIWNDALINLGIAVTSDKKERMVQQEAESNQEEKESFQNSRYLERLIFVEKINKKFGLNIKVEVAQGGYDGVQ